MKHRDAVVVGAGPNGLAAAIELAWAGLSVVIHEAKDTPGGAVKTLPLTLPGFRHDPFSSVYPLAAGSPFFASLPLGDHGLEWVHSPAPLAHPLDDEPAILLERSIDETVRSVGDSGAFYRKTVSDFGEQWWPLAESILGPLRLPAHPLLMARFGLKAIRSLSGTIGRQPPNSRAAALLAGNAAHAGIPLDQPASTAFGLVLHAAGHSVGWPFPLGGAGSLSDALVSLFHAMGGRIERRSRVSDLAELPTADVTLLDLTPRQILRVAGRTLPPAYADRLRRFRYGSGVFKMDWALSERIPWRDPSIERAATVHLGGSAAAIEAALAEVDAGGNPDRPFVILTQPSLFDSTRAPAGAHTAWAYCHVPNGSAVDRGDAIEAQIERFAPGFRDVVLHRSVLAPAALERLDGNLVGGDVNGGAPTLDQLFFRPMPKADPYRTPVDGVFICSASTPPGGGVHGMCGYHAARSALRWLGIAPRTSSIPHAGSAE